MVGARGGGIRRTGLLDITTTATDGLRAELAVHGELDMATVGLLIHALCDQLRAGRRFVRLDMSGLSFLGGRGLAALVTAHNAFLAKRGMLTLSGVTAPAQRLLTLTHLDEVLFTDWTPHDGPASAW